VITCLEAVLETQSRERISIDLQGLKAALMERSQALGVSPSELLRKALVQALDSPATLKRASAVRPPWKTPIDRTRLCLRMGQEEATATLTAAQRAGMSPGDYVAGLVAGVPILLNGGSRSEHIEALTTSNAHVANLSRNVYALTRFLNQANVEQARVYRDMLDTLNGDVRRHLMLASSVLAELGGPGRSTRHSESRRR
jgi:hypothetical protein